MSESTSTSGATASSTTAVPAVAAAAVLGKSDISDFITIATPKCAGFEFNDGATLDALLGACISTGFQATNLGLAIEEINRMVSNCSF